MKPILYSYFRSSSAYRVRVAMHLKKIDFDYQAVHLLKDGGQQHALNYRSINPMGQVPLLVDGDVLLTQSMAIIQYLDEKWPEPRLFPLDIAEKHYMIELCEIINSGIQPLQNLSVLQKLEKDFSVDQDAKNNWAQYFITEGFKTLEKRISKTAGTYSVGNSVSALDCFIVPQVFAAIRFGIDMNLYPTIKKVADKLNELEAFKKAHPSNQLDTPLEN